MRRLMVGIILFCVIAANSIVFAETNDPLLVGYDPTLPPLHFQNESIHDGFAVDMMNEMALRMEREVRYIAMPQSEAIQKLQNGEIDILLSAHFNEEHARVMEFTDSIIGTSIGLIVHEDNQDIEGIPQLTNAITSLQRDTLEYEFLRNIRRIKYHVTSNQIDALELLFKGRADAFVGNILTAQYVLEETGRADDYKVVGSYLLPVDYTMAVRKEHYSLLEQLNRAIREVKSDGTYSELYEKWFESENELADRLWFVIKVIGTLLFLAIILFSIGIRWNRQLQKEVEKKTTVLNELNKTLQEQIEQTKNSNEFQKQILNSSPRGIVTVNQHGEITSFNPKAIDISGVKTSTIGESYERVSLLEQLLKTKFNHVLQLNKLYLGEEAVWERPADNRTYYLRYYIYPLYDFEKQVNGIIVTFEDVTEERTLRLQVFEQEKNQALGRVVAGIAHEIRNPLTSIKTFVELIPRKYANERFQKEISTYVPQEIERVSQLIEGLIDYAKPKQQNKEIVDVAEVLKECTILFERTAMNKGLSMTYEAGENLFIKADPSQLKQVIINLIINSLDAMEMHEDKQHSLLSIRAYSKKQNVVIDVIDGGIGMSQEEQLQALEPFFTTKAKGTGLGLAIAHQYVRENDGKLKIVSEKGKGTTISLTFSSNGTEESGDETHSHY